MNDGGSVVTLTMTVTSTNTCYPATASGIYPITVREVPIASIGGSTTICQGDDTTDITFTGMGGIAPYVFTYLMNGNTQSISTTSTTTLTPQLTEQAGQYVYSLVSVSNGYNCSQSQSGQARVTINRLPEAIISQNTTVCQSDNAPIVTMTGSNGSAPYTFTYTLKTNTITGPSTSTVSSGNRASFTHPTNSEGNYVYQITSVSYTQGGKVCSKDQTDTMLIVVNPLPDATFTKTADVCKDSAQPILTFKGTTGTAPYTFTFKVNSENNASVSTTANSDTYNYGVKTDKAGTYNYVLQKVTDGKGCYTQPNITQTIKVYENPTANFVATPIRTTILEPTIDIMESSIAAETYQWSFGDGNKSVETSPNNHTYKDSGRYELKLLTTTFGGACKDSMIQEIVIEQPKLVYIPNSFTPNEDGVNDEFRIEGEGIEKLEMRIYDRWGNMVFYTNDKTKGWDGKMKGQLVPIDAYVVVAIIKDLKGHDTTFRGTLNVIK